MDGYYNRKPMRAGPPHMDRCSRQVTTLPPRGRRVPLRDADPALLSRDIGQSDRTTRSHTESIPGNEQEMSLRYHIDSIVRIICNWYNERSLACRVVLVLLVLYPLFSLVTTLIQFVNLSVSSIYTILGIFASATAVYEFLLKRQQKRR